MQTSSELIQRTHDDPFRKISTNLLAYVLQFCGVEDLKNFSYLNSKFKKAFNKDLIWEIQVLGDYLFCTEEKRKFSSWRDYYLSLKKLKRNFQGGRSNKNFQMRPARGHKRIITALVCDENKSNGKEFIISGDEGGVVLQWSLNEDGEYFAQEILKTEGVVTDIVYDKDSRFLIIADDQSNTFIFEEFKLLHKINMNIQGTKNILMHDKRIYASTDYHNFCNVKYSPGIQCWGLKEGLKEREFQPSYSYSTYMQLIEENKQLKSKFDLNNHFTFDSQPPSSIFIKNNQLYLISNYDLEEFFLVSLYTSSSLANLFVFDLNDHKKEMRIHVDLVYLFEINSIRNHLVVVGIDKEGWLQVIFYSQNNCELVSSNKIYQSSIKLLNTIQLSRVTGAYKANFYKTCIVGNEDEFLILIGNQKFFNFKQNGQKFVSCEFNLNEENKQINCTSFDKFKFALGYNDNTIKVYSSKDKNLWHILLGGSLTVVPKSFIPHPTLEGFHKVVLTKYSIIGVMGNLIREYVYMN